MAYFHVVTILFIVLTLCESSSSTKLSMSSKDMLRKKRDTDIEPDTSVLPDLGTMLRTQNYVQSSYFLGQCLMCPPGAQGQAGQQGDRGMPGRDGRDAILVGIPSAGQVSTARPQQQQQQDNFNASEEYIPLGAKYTRWGRPTCANDSEIIYEGVMAGAHYNQAGGATNYLCLSKEPIFDRPVAAFQHNAFLYGTEYETSGSQILPHLQDAEAPCAVCLATFKTVTMMIPGRNQCPSGPRARNWKLEYKGFLMSQHHTQARTEYICVDAEAEGIPRTSGDHNGALLYIVEAKCVTGGGLPCPPYTEGFEVTCAVCSL